MVAEQRDHAPELHPANEELGRRRPEEAADVVSELILAAQPHARTHLDADAQAVEARERVPAQFPA